MILKSVKEERESYKQTSEELKGFYPGVRGLNVRRVLLSDDDLDRVVSSSIVKVCWLCVILYTLDGVGQLKNGIMAYGWSLPTSRVGLDKG